MFFCCNISRYLKLTLRTYWIASARFIVTYRWGKFDFENQNLNTLQCVTFCLRVEKFSLLFWKNGNLSNHPIVFLLFLSFLRKYRKEYFTYLKIKQDVEMNLFSWRQLFVWQDTMSIKLLLINTFNLPFNH